jgi:hypothetical protein
VSYHPVSSIIAFKESVAIRKETGAYSKIERCNQYPIITFGGNNKKIG